LRVRYERTIKEEVSSALKTRLFALLLGLILSFIFIVNQQSEATLGGSADTVESDGKALFAVKGLTRTYNRYTVHELDSSSTAVREYVSPSGIVFGIAWKGMVHPDLAQLLGSYADEYQEALKHTSHLPGRRRLQVKAERVVVEKWGHMRNLQGRAYDPNLIPSGVSVDEIR